MSEPTYSKLEDLLEPLAKVVYSSRDMPSIAEAIPSGLFDNRPIEQYIRSNMERNHLTNNFKVLKRLRKKSLYIVATILDTAERETFGYDEKNDVTISEAVWASTALPGFYKPVRLKGVDYVDGAVRRTANIDVAVSKGAELIVCYNPFRPFNNELVLEYLREENRYVTKGKTLSQLGIFMVLNQAVRTLFHTRLKYSLEHYQKNPHFHGDIILIEPKADDALFFDINPLAFWQRAKAAKCGFNSVRESIEKYFDPISKIFNAYGIEISREKVDLDYSKIVGAEDDEKTMEILESESPRRRFRVVKGRTASA
jgi:predicted acylesterase/phospholipase RssA